MHNQPRGFTLLELLVVVILVGLMAGVVVVAVKPQLDRAVMARVINEIESADRRQRAAAMTSPLPSTMTIDRRNHAISFALIDRKIELPGNLRIEGFRIGVAGQRLGNRGSVVTFRSNGQSDSYAIGLRHGGSTAGDSDASVAGGQVAVTWLVVAGISGQATVHVGNDLVDQLMGPR